MTRAKQVRRKTLAQHAASIEQAVNALNTAQFEAIKKIFSINNETLPSADLSIQEFQDFLGELDSLFVQGSTAVAAINETITNFGLTKLVYTTPKEEVVEEVITPTFIVESSEPEEDVTPDTTEETTEELEESEEDLPLRF